MRGGSLRNGLHCKTTVTTVTRPLKFKPVQQIRKQANDHRAMSLQFRMSQAAPDDTPVPRSHPDPALHDEAPAIEPAGPEEEAIADSPASVTTPPQHPVAPEGSDVPESPQVPAAGAGGSGPGPAEPHPSEQGPEGPLVVCDQPVSLEPDTSGATGTDVEVTLGSESNNCVG